jgi:hypothetical protein
VFINYALMQRKPIVNPLTVAYMKAGMHDWQRKAEDHGLTRSVG